MKILQRTREIFSANLNDLVDHFEQPERMSRHALREMETLLATTSTAVASSLAAEKLLTGAQQDEQRQIELWRERARSALSRGDESLARKAISRQLEHAGALAALDSQLQQVQTTNAALRSELDRLKREHAAAQRRHATLLAAQAAANARRQIAGAATSGRNLSLTARRFDHFCRKLEQSQAEALALAELDAEATDATDDHWEYHERSAAIDAELDHLRSEID